MTGHPALTCRLADARRAELRDAACAMRGARTGRMRAARAGRTSTEARSRVARPFARWLATRGRSERAARPDRPA